MDDGSSIDRAERSLDSLARRQRYDERNRLTLLSIHGWMGLLVGVTMFTTRPPTIWTRLYGPAWDWVIAGPPMLGGVILLAGLYRGRQLAAEATGMALLLSWDLGMTVLLIANGMTTRTASYAVAVYFGLACLMATHLLTLARYIRGRRAHAAK